jgi:hypothetical protein
VPSSSTLVKILTIQLIQLLLEFTASCQTRQNQFGKIATGFLVASILANTSLAQLNNMAFHNLCSTAQTPPGTEFLLGLGLKYCIKSPLPFQRLEKSIRRIQRSVRLHFAFKTFSEEDSESEDENEEAEARVQYIPSLYLPSDWQPPPAPESAEHAMSKFDEKLNVLIRALPRSRRYNLSRSQQHCLGDLAQRQDLIIFPTDTNLGPSIAERRPYIKQILAEHSLNEHQYLYLPADDVKNELDAQRCRFLKIYSDRAHTLPSEAEETYFKRSLTKDNLGQTRVPQFYGIYKVHKNGKPKTRPIVSSVKSISKSFSKWVDYWLKKVVRTILPTYIQDAGHLMTALHNTFPSSLPPGARLFSVDAIAMYSNIDTEHGIQVLTSWLRDYCADLPQCMPVDFIIKALAEIIRSNIFQSGDTFWGQTGGCAMGTSATVNYAYLYVGLLELQRLIPRFKTCLPFFKRFIDDVIEVWLPQPNDNLTWNAFLHCLNRWGALRWTCDGHVDSLFFLDLGISIGPNRHLIFQTYQKPMNLYLYISPSSAHPDKMLRSLIFGRLQAYWLQNTHLSDIYGMAVLLARRRIARGYSYPTLNPLFAESAIRLQAQLSQRPTLPPPPTDPNDPAKKPIIFHLKYHPRGIQRSQVRQVYLDTLAQVLPNQTLILAVSRPRNLRD